MRLIISVFVLFLIVAVIVWRKKRRATEQAAGEQARDLMATTSKFHAVSIRPGPGACDAALGLQGQRFLSDAAPAIPLPSCDSAGCRCRFVHFEDRRSGDERRSPFPGTIGLDTGIYQQERRESADRRKEPRR